MPNLGAIGSNAAFCESFSGLGLGRPILPGAEDEEIYMLHAYTCRAFSAIFRVCSCDLLLKCLNGGDEYSRV